METNSNYYPPRITPATPPEQDDSMSDFEKAKRRAEIMNIRDDRRRIKAIKENKHLFESRRF